jgi:hypothetical protein
MFTMGTKFTGALSRQLMTTHDPQLCFNRGYFSIDGTIMNGVDGPVIAHVERQITMLRKEYRVILAQGVDVALVAGMVICLDDQEKSHKNAPALGGGRWG